MNALQPSEGKAARVRAIGVVSAVAAVALMTAGCGGSGGTPAKTPDKSGTPTASETPGGKESSTPEPSTKTLRGVSVTVPGSATWREEAGDSSEVYDEVAYIPDDSADATPTCRISITVEGRVPTGMNGYKAYLRGLDAQDITDDPDAPQGAEGVFAKLSGPTDPGDSNEPFEQTIRSWVTTDRTVLSVIITTPEGGSEICDGDQILGTMSWDGVEPFPLPKTSPS